MAPYTRRGLLHVATAVVGGWLWPINRCHSTVIPVRFRDHQSNLRNTETDPPRVLLRADPETPPVRLTDPDQGVFRARVNRPLTRWNPERAPAETTW